MFSAAAKSAPALYPHSPEAYLRAEYVGKDLKDAPCPAAVLDVAKLRHNCAEQLRAVDAFQLSFRAHVKTHKTAQLAKLQLGEDVQRPLRVIVGSVPEAEILLPWLVESSDKGREVSVLHGIAPSSTCFARYAAFRQAGVSVAYMIDHPSQLVNLLDRDQLASSSSRERIPVFVKIDTGYHRAGVGTESAELQTVLQAIAQHSKESSSAPRLKLLGLYSHLGSSGSVSTPEEALGFLHDELERGGKAMDFLKSLKLDFDLPADEAMVLSIGASPGVTAIQNLLSTSAAAARVEEVLKAVKTKCEVELHAGVYPTLDVQQLATHARPTAVSMSASTATPKASPTMDVSDIALTIMAEVLSLYPERPTPEALIGAGVLALGREPAKNYSGWGIVAANPWRPDDGMPLYTEDERTGWIVGRVAQEHGILTWEGAREQVQLPAVGEKLLIFPNHACIAGAQYGWYLVVDSSADGGTQIVDVWVRARGW